MKHLVLISALLTPLAFLAWGCGSSTDAGHAGARVTEVTGPHGKLKIRVPSGRPPKALVVKELREGSGPEAARAGDEVAVDYVGIDYGTRKAFYDTWEQAGPSHFHLKAMRTGWERGLRGMKVGGRRELIVPSRLAYGTGALIYLVDLLEVRPWVS
ncbi:MAG TPA: FKBP-type peptidyl-prolyl cis-trans isomerase [Solirubrobacterales bacterium]|jgi:peptidylprolyl isomerase